MFKNMIQNTIAVRRNKMTKATLLYNNTKKIFTGHLILSIRFNSSAEEVIELIY